MQKKYWIKKVFLLLYLITNWIFALSRHHKRFAHFTKWMPILNTYFIMHGWKLVHLLRSNYSFIVKLTPTFNQVSLENTLVLSVKHTDGIWKLHDSVKLGMILCTRCDVIHAKVVCKESFAEQELARTNVTQSRAEMLFLSDYQINIT